MASDSRLRRRRGSSTASSSGRERTSTSIRSQLSTARRSVKATSSIAKGETKLRCGGARVPSVDRGRRIRPPLPRRRHAVQGDGRLASRAADERRARLPEPARGVRLRRRGGDARDARHRARRRVLPRERSCRRSQMLAARVRRELFASIGSCSFERAGRRAAGARDPVKLGVFTAARRRAARRPDRGRRRGRSGHGRFGPVRGTVPGTWLRRCPSRRCSGSCRSRSRTTSTSTRRSSTRRTWGGCSGRIRSR